jgi:chromosome segregation ATPase
VLQEKVGQIAEAGSDPELETRFADLGREIEALTRRLSEVDSATSSGWGHASEAVASLERRLSEVTQRVDAAEHDRAGAAADVAHTEEEWSEQHASIVEASRALEERVTRLSAAADDSAARLVSLENTVAATDAGVVERDLTLRALSERFETASARVDGLVRNLQTALETMPARGSDPELDVRLDGLATEIHSLAVRFGEVESAAATQAAAVSADAATAAALLEHRLAELAGRLETVERGSAAAAVEIARASTIWTDERASIRDQLAALAGDEPALAELGSRLDAMERSVGTATADVERASEAWAAERSSLEAKLDALAAAVSEIGSSSASETPEQDLTELERRFDSIERDRSKLAAEIAGATAFWSSGLGAIEARLDEVAANGKEAPPARDPAVEEALADLARRLDAVEQSRHAGAEEVAHAPESWDADRNSLAASLAELSRRIDAVDTGRIELVHTPSSNEPGGGDGRFRVELRALELRMEHAEAAARENREAVLVQLERLASRIEWRLQSLETDPNADEGSASLPQAATAGGPMGEVVPIRGGDA